MHHIDFKVCARSTLWWRPSTLWLCYLRIIGKENGLTSKMCWSPHSGTFCRPCCWKRAVEHPSISKAALSLKVNQKTKIIIFQEWLGIWVYIVFVDSYHVLKQIFADIVKSSLERSQFEKLHTMRTPNFLIVNTFGNMKDYQISGIVSEQPLSCMTQSMTFIWSSYSFLIWLIFDWIMSCKFRASWAPSR